MHRVTPGDRRGGHVDAPAAIEPLNPGFGGALSGGWAERLRCHAAWWPAGAEEVWIGLTTTDPEDGTLSEPTWTGYARVPVSAEQVVADPHWRVSWTNSSRVTVTLRGWFATDARGRVVHVRIQRPHVLGGGDWVGLVNVPGGGDQSFPVPLGLMREARR